MKDPNSTPPGSKKNIGLVTAALVLFVAIIFFIALAGIAIGRSSVRPITKAEPTTGIITEIQEVTREVIVVVTATSEAKMTVVEQAAPSDGPTTMETALPEAGFAPAPELNPATPASELDFSTFNEAWNFIEGEFDGELPEEKMRLYAAISGSLETLDDQYTRFIRPDVAERMREDLNGSVSGIGAFVRENPDGLIEITRPIDGQPADLAGLQTGDVIIAINGESIVHLGFDEVLLMVRGPEGTPITLTVIREGENETLDFTVVRAIFEVPVIISEMYEVDGQQIAYIRLTSFTRNADTSLQDALSTLLADDPQGLIFDLRDNGGGFLDQAVTVADAFLPEGTILYEKNSKGDIDKTFESIDGDLAENIPLVVLVNGGSASASEIVAGAVQDHERGVLIGETTFGKGSVQIIHTLSDGSELRITIARWFTPDGNSISENGIAPDIEEPTPPDLGGEDDNQIQRAIDYLVGSE